MDSRAEIEAVLTGLAHTWNTHDMMANATYFTEDADFVNVLGSKYEGREAIKAQHIKLHRGIMRDSVLSILDRSVRMLSPDIALAHVRWVMRGAQKVPGWNVPEVRNGIFTYVLVLQDGHWLVTGAHNTDIVNIPNN